MEERVLTNYDHCRISGSKNLIPFLKCEIPLAGGFLKSEDEFATDKNYPLTLSFCPDSGLVQVNEAIRPDILFKNYFYKTGSIKTLSDHFEEMARMLKDENPNNKRPSILEIGCNDFSMLKHLVGSKFNPIIGVDPSDVSKNNQVEGVKLINEPFTKELAQKIVTEHGRVDYIVACNCFAHIENIKDVAEGIKIALKEFGTAIIEVHWLGHIIANMQFPFIYHEHQYYYSLKSIGYLLNQFGLSVYKAEHIPIHGGSIRYYVGYNDNHQIDYSVDVLGIQEMRLNLYEQDTFVTFEDKIQRLKHDTLTLLDRLKITGKSVAGYGASGQANTLLSLYGITKKQIPYIVDDAPLKIGCFTPHTHIPIVSSKVLKEKPTDFIFCLAYTFINEIRGRNPQVHSNWIVPLPRVEIL